MAKKTKPYTEDDLALRVGKLTLLWNDVHFFIYAIFVRLMNDDYQRADAVFFAARLPNDT